MIKALMKVWILGMILTSPILVSAQVDRTQTHNSSAQSYEETSSVELTADLLGISREMDELERLGKSRPAPASAEAWNLLSLHQRIVEAILDASLQVDAATAQIDNEIARSTEVTSYLADRRDRTVNRTNLLSILLGGGLSAVSAGLQFSANESKATAATGIAGGAIAVGMSLYGMHAQRGGTRELGAESAMLAKFFDRPEMSSSHYPPIVWRFMNQVVTSEPKEMTRRDGLVHSWIELDRIPPSDSPKSQRQIDQVTSIATEHRQHTIDDLNDRIAMLRDVEAKLSFLKLDLMRLMSTVEATATFLGEATPSSVSH